MFHGYMLLILTLFLLMQEVIQEQFHQQLFNALIPTLEAPEPRYVSNTFD